MLYFTPLTHLSYHPSCPLNLINNLRIFEHRFKGKTSAKKQVKQIKKEDSLKIELVKDHSQSWDKPDPEPEPDADVDMKDGETPKSKTSKKKEDVIIDTNKGM